MARCHDDTGAPAAQLPASRDADTQTALFLQRTAGNRAVTALIQRDWLPALGGFPAKPKPTPSAAVQSGDPDQISDVNPRDWAAAQNADRRRAIHIMLDNTMFMAFWSDDKVVLNIANSYPDRDSMTDDDIAAIKKAIKRGSIKGRELTGYFKLTREFEAKVEARAGENVKNNLEKLDKIAKQYGIGREAEGGASGIPTAMDKLQEAAGKVADARHLQFKLREIPVGRKVEGLLPTGPVINFDPNSPPEALGPAQPGETSGMARWTDVKRAHDKLEAAIGKTMTANPALHLLAATPALDQRLAHKDDRLHFGKTALAGFETAPGQLAKRELDNAHAKMKSKLELVRDKLKAHKIDPLSLDALGFQIAATDRYANPFARWAMEDAVESYKSDKEKISTFLDIGAAIALVGATIGTAGGALAISAVLAGASAGVKLSHAADLKETAEAGVAPEDRMTSEVKVSAADLEAAIAVAVAVLSVLPIAKGLLFRRAASAGEELLKLRTLSPAELKNPPKWAKDAVLQSIREVGVVQTAETAGLKIENLGAYLESGTPEYELWQAAVVLRGGPSAGAASVRRRLSVQEIRSMKERGVKVLTHRSYEGDVIANQTIKPTGTTNPNAPRVVWFGEGFEGFGYGDHCMIIEFDAVKPLYPNANSPGEWFTTTEIAAERGYWAKIEDVRAALKGGK